MLRTFDRPKAAESSKSPTLAHLAERSTGWASPSLLLSSSPSPGFRHHNQHFLTLSFILGQIDGYWIHRATSSTHKRQPQEHKPAGYGGQTHCDTASSSSCFRRTTRYQKIDILARPPLGLTGGYYAFLWFWGRWWVCLFTLLCFCVCVLACWCAVLGRGWGGTLAARFYAFAGGGYYPAHFPYPSFIPCLRTLACRKPASCSSLAFWFGGCCCSSQMTECLVILLYIRYPFLFYAFEDARAVLVHAFRYFLYILELDWLLLSLLLRDMVWDQDLG